MHDLDQKFGFRKELSQHFKAASLFVIGLLPLGFCLPGHAEAASPAMFFEDSSVIGIGDTITALQVPIRTATGDFIFKDVTIVLDVDTKGNLRWATAKPLATPSPVLQTSNIRAGIYLSPTSTQEGIRITGPTAIGNGGEAEWAITVGPGKIANISPPNPAVFYTGPLAKSPLEARLAKAGLTSTQYNYGVIGTTSGTWFSNALVGLRLIGNQLAVALFTDSSGTDHKDPVTQIIYTFSH